MSSTKDPFRPSLSLELQQLSDPDLPRDIHSEDPPDSDESWQASQALCRAAMPNNNHLILELIETILDACRRSGLSKIQQLAALNAGSLAFQQLYLNPTISEHDLEAIILKSIFNDLTLAGCFRRSGGASHA